MTWGQRDSAADLERQVARDEWRRRLVSAGCFDPADLSEQGRRILRWLTEWDDWTVDGVAEMLAAAHQAGRDAAHDVPPSSGTVAP